MGGFSIGPGMLWWGSNPSIREQATPDLTGGGVEPLQGVGAPGTPQPLPPHRCDHPHDGTARLPRAEWPEPGQGLAAPREIHRLFSNLNGRAPGSRCLWPQARHGVGKRHLPARPAAGSPTRDCEGTACSLWPGFCPLCLGGSGWTPQADTAARGSHPPQTASMLLRCGVRTVWGQGGTPPRPSSSAQPGEEDAAGAVPVVEVLPHVLWQDHHQVVDVVIFVGRDPCGGKHMGELDLPALPCPTPGTKKAASPPWEQRNVWLVMGPGSAKVLNLLSHSRDT